MLRPRRLRTTLLPLLLCLAALQLSGCLWRLEKKAAAPTGIFFNDVTSPNFADDPQSTVIRYDPEQMEILGWVENNAGSAGFYGSLPGYGGSDVLAARESSYSNVLAKLRAEHDFDGLLNTVVDTNLWRLNFYVVRFSSVRTHVGGIAYRMRLRPGETPGERAVRLRLGLEKLPDGECE